MMQIDAYTVLLFGFFIKGVLGALFVVFWFDDRRASWFLWWGLAFFLGALAAAMFMLRGQAPDLLTIGVGNATMLGAFASVWQGARIFGGRPPLWGPLLAMPALWLALCFMPAFLDHVGARVVVSSLMAALLLGLAAMEFWRGRAEVLRSRWPVIVLFLLFALFFLLRVPLVGLLPFPFGALPMQPGWLGAFNLVIFAHVVIVTVLIVSLTKERLELDQRNKAQTDALTGALNRRAFGHRGARLVRRHEHEGAPLCLAVLDLDCFKELNDRHGHAGGDEVLVRFVSLVHDQIRPTDLLFRIGGEEFCCLLPYTSAGQGARVAERIRTAIEAQVFALADGEARVTVSVGVASTESVGCDIDVLMRQADLAVYEAKRQGRNRVVVAAGRAGSGLAALASSARA